MSEHTLSEPSSKLTGILVGIEMLLDMRYGLLSLLNPEYADGLVSTRDYYARKVDRFDVPGIGEVTTADYKQAVSESGNAIARSSLVTGFLASGTLRDFFETQFHLSDVAPVRPVSDLYINVYPLTLDDNVVQALQQAVLHYLVPWTPKVEVVSHSPQELTPDTVLSRYALMYMYDPTDWINAHHETIAGHRLSRVGLFTPRLARVRDLTRAEQARFRQAGITDYYNELIIPAFRGHIGLSFVHPVEACLYGPHNPLFSSEQKNERTEKMDAAPAGQDGSSVNPASSE